MASILSSTLFSFYLILILTSSTIAAGLFSKHFAKTTTPPATEKTTHLHFYFHDILSGNNPTALRITGPQNAFGMTVMIDDPLTEGTEPHSQVVGRAQGMYSLASQHDARLLMVMDFAFTYGKYNGSALSIMGLNHVLDEVREIPVIGGSGVFRFARGYALAKTSRYNAKTGDAVVEYNVFVMHS